MSLPSLYRNHAATPLLCAAQTRSDRWGARCPAKAKDTFTAETVAALNADPDAKFAGWTLKHANIEGYIGLSFCGTHSPERLIRKEMVEGRIRHEDYERRKRAEAERQNTKEGLIARIAALGIPVPGYGLYQTERSSGYTIDGSLLRALIAAAEQATTKEGVA